MTAVSVSKSQKRLVSELLPLLPEGSKPSVFQCVLDDGFMFPVLAKDPEDAVTKLREWLAVRSERHLLR